MARINPKPISIGEYAAKQEKRAAAAKEYGKRSTADIEQRYRRINRVSGPATKSEMIGNILDSEGHASHFRHVNSDAMEEQHRAMKPAERAAAAKAHQEEQGSRFRVVDPEGLAQSKSADAHFYSHRAKTSLPERRGERHHAAAKAHREAIEAHLIHKGDDGDPELARHRKLAESHAKMAEKYGNPISAADPKAIREKLAMESQMASDRRASRLEVRAEEAAEKASGLKAFAEQSSIRAFEDSMERAANRDPERTPAEERRIAAVMSERDKQTEVRSRPEFAAKYAEVDKLGEAMDAETDPAKARKLSVQYSKAMAGVDAEVRKAAREESKVGKLKAFAGGNGFQPLERVTDVKQADYDAAKAKAEEHSAKDQHKEAHAAHNAAANLARSLGDSAAAQAHQDKADNHLLASAAPTGKVEQLKAFAEQVAPTATAAVVNVASGGGKAPEGGHRELSAAARALSKGIKTTGEGDHGAAAQAHSAAAAAHRAKADEHKAAGNKLAANAHIASATVHERAAAEHQLQVGAKGGTFYVTESGKKVYTKK
jgi:hypothetical protein